jgi:putative ATP-dependent endonuclease of OLD family
LLGELYRAESTPVLALEEPETHLHPQAARTLFGHVAQLKGQKIVSTHSPYFLQHVPFRDLRVVRAGPDGTIIKSLPREFRCRVPNLQAFAPVIAASGSLLEYDGGLSELVIKGSLPTPTYKNLLLACQGQPEMAAMHA